MVEEKAPKVYKVFIWRNPLRGEVACVASNRREAERMIKKENPAFAKLMWGEPLVIDPSTKGAIVHRWRRG